MSLVRHLLKRGNKNSYGGRIYMGKSYDKNRRYNERDALLLSLEMQSEILLEFKKLNKLIRVSKSAEKAPKTNLPVKK
jgi:hypothetical protein